MNYTDDKNKIRKYLENYGEFLGYSRIDGRVIFKFDNNIFNKLRKFNYINAEYVNSIESYVQRFDEDLNNIVIRIEKIRDVEFNILLREYKLKRILE